MSIKILVTGGSGFIGTNIVQFYLDNNVEVLSIDIAEPRNIDHNPYFKKIDICNKNLLINCIDEFFPTQVIHLAARTDLNGSTLSDYSANTKGTENVIDAITKLGKVNKAIFASSMLVCEVGYRPVDYEDYKPSTFYGESKVLMEKIIKSRKSINFEWNIIRPTSIWGPWFGEPYRNFFDLLARGGYFNLKGRTATKTFGYIGNVVHQINRLLFSLNKSINCKTFYLGDNPPINISEWADEILIEMGKSPAIKVPFSLLKIVALCGDLLGTIGLKIPMNSFRLKNMTTNNILSLEDLCSAVGEPPYSRTESIRHTLEWLKNH